MRFRNSNQMVIEIVSNVQELKSFSRPYASEEHNKNFGASEYSKNKLSVKTDKDFIAIVNQGISKCY